MEKKVTIVVQVHVEFDYGSRFILAKQIPENRLKKQLVK